MELPFFSFLLGHVHPHVLVIPFALLAIGLSLDLGGAQGNLLVMDKSWYKRRDILVGSTNYGAWPFFNTWTFQCMLFY